MNANTSIENLLKSFGFNRTVALFTHIVRTKFDEDPVVRCKEVKQFIREELDGARQGDCYAKEFAKRLGAKIGSYKGAMKKEVDYPIDGECGPQQTLNTILAPVYNSNRSFGAKLRCAVVEHIYKIEKIIYKNKSISNELQNEFNQVDKDLGMALEEMPDLLNACLEKPAKKDNNNSFCAIKNITVVTDLFDSSPRENIDLATRLVEHAQDLNEKFGMSLSEIYEEIITKTPLELKSDWVGECLVNYGCFIGTVGATLDFKPTTWFRGIEPSISELIEFYVFSLWNLTKGIYRFDEKLLRSLPDADLNSTIPFHIFKNLPEWCVYVETPNWNIRGLEPYGYFALLDYEFQTGFILRILLDLPNQLYNIKVPIQKNVSFYDIMNFESEHVFSKENEYIQFDKFAHQAINLKIDFNKDRMVFKNPSTCANFIKINWFELTLDVLKFVIPQILYLSAKNKELTNLSNPHQPIMKMGLTHDKHYKTILHVFKTPSLIYVGKKVNSENNLKDKTQGSEDQLKFIYKETGLQNYLEIKHSEVKSVNEEITNEENSAKMFVSLTNAMSLLLNEYEKVKSVLEKEKRDSVQITNEGLKYLEEMNNLQDQLNEAQRQLSMMNSVFHTSSKHKDFCNKNIEKLLKKILVEKTVLMPSECLSFIEEFWSDRVLILSTAWESAKIIDKFFQNGSKLLNLLIRLATDYYDNFLKGGDNLAKKVFSDSEYAAQESETVNRSDLIKQRCFLGIQMQKHLKIGVKNDISTTARVYFSVDVDKRLILIGYCGKHLDIASGKY